MGKLIWKKKLGYRSTSFWKIWSVLIWFLWRYDCLIFTNSKSSDFFEWLDNMYDNSAYEKSEKINDINQLKINGHWTYSLPKRELLDSSLFLQMDLEFQSTNLTLEKYESIVIGTQVFLTGGESVDLRDCLYILWGHFEMFWLIKRRKKNSRLKKEKLNIFILFSVKILVLSKIF